MDDEQLEQRKARALEEEEGPTGGSKGYGADPDAELIEEEQEAESKRSAGDG